MQEGEVIQEGDEVDISQHLNEGPVWVKTTCAGQKAPNPLYPAHRVYRRPTQRPPDTVDSAALQADFLASADSTSQALS